VVVVGEARQTCCSRYPYIVIGFLPRFYGENVLHYIPYVPRSNSYSERFKKKKTDRVWLWTSRTSRRFKREIYIFPVRRYTVRHFVYIFTGVQQRRRISPVVYRYYSAREKYYGTRERNFALTSSFHGFTHFRRLPSGSGKSSFAIIGFGRLGKPYAGELSSPTNIGSVCTVADYGEIFDDGTYNTIIRRDCARKRGRARGVNSASAGYRVWRNVVDT